MGVVDLAQNLPNSRRTGVFIAVVHGLTDRRQRQPARCDGFHQGITKGCHGFGLGDLKEPDHNLAKVLSIAGRFKISQTSCRDFLGIGFAVFKIFKRLQEPLIGKGQALRRGKRHARRQPNGAGGR